MGSLTEGREDNQINFTVQNTIQNQVKDTTSRGQCPFSHYIVSLCVCSMWEYHICNFINSLYCYYSPQKEGENNRNQKIYGVYTGSNAHL